MVKLIAELSRDRRGVAGVEYALIAALIVLAMMGGLTTLGGGVGGTWFNVSNQVSSAT